MSDLIERLEKSAEDFEYAAKHGERTMEVEKLLREAVEEIKRLRAARGAGQ